VHTWTVTLLRKALRAPEVLLPPCDVELLSGAFDKGAVERGARDNRGVDDVARLARRNEVDLLEGER
jgi:hypothetical protein